MLKHTFSAFWLRSSVVSVLISVKTGIFSTEKQFSHQFVLGAVARDACVPLRQSCLGLALFPSVAHPFILLKRNRFELLIINCACLHLLCDYYLLTYLLNVMMMINGVYCMCLCEEQWAAVLVSSLNAELIIIEKMPGCLILLNSYQFQIVTHSQ